MLSKMEKILKSDMHLTMDIVGQLNGLNGSFDTLHFMIWMILI